MMKRILILVAISLFMGSTASAAQGGGGESTKKKENPKKTSGTKSANTTPPRPPAPPAREEEARSPIPLPSPFTPVVDYSNVIDADTRKKLESIYVNLKQHADIEFAVVTVDTTGDQDIFDYSLALARRWGIGSKAGGFLLLVAIKDRKYFTQVSDNLEADLSNGLVGQIQRERLVPQFRKGNYSQGIYDTVQAYVATLAQKRGFTVLGLPARWRNQLRANATPQLCYVGWERVIKTDGHPSGLNSMEAKGAPGLSHEFKLIRLTWRKQYPNWQWSKR